MPLFFIVGAPGTGKSSVREVLQERGYEAYDTDKRGYGMAQWQHNETGYIHPKSSIKEKDRTEEFINNHSWKVPQFAIEDLKTLSKSTSNIYLCGNVTNANEISKISLATFALVVDTDTLKNRILTRTSGDWGKQPHELKQTLALLKDANDDYTKAGYILIDATQPLLDVVDEILRNVAELEPNNP